MNEISDYCMILLNETLPLVCSPNQSKLQIYSIKIEYGATANISFVVYSSFISISKIFPLQIQQSITSEELILI